MRWLQWVHGDLYRILCTRNLRIALILPAVACVLRIFWSKGSAHWEEARRIAQGLKVAASAGNGFGPMADGLRTGGAVLSLVALVVGAMIWVRERESGVQMLVLLDRRRVLVVLSRAAALSVLVLLSMALMLGGAAASSAIAYDLKSLVEDGFEMATATELWTDTLKAALAAMPGLLGSACFGLLVSVLTSSSGAAVAGTLIPFVLFDLLQGLLGDSARFVFVRYVPFLGEHSTLARLTDVARAYSDAGWEENELLMATAVPALELLVVLLIACLWSRRRE